MGHMCSVCRDTKVRVYACPDCKIRVCFECIKQMHFFCPVCERDELNSEIQCSSCHHFVKYTDIRECYKCCKKCHCICKSKKYWFPT